MEPLVRIAAQRASQHVLELTRNVTSRGVERRHVVRRLASENLLRCLPAERRTAEQCEVDRGRERIEVGALIDALAEQLFRCGELRRPAPRRRPTEARSPP